MMVIRLVDNLTRDLKSKDNSHVLNKSNIRNVDALRWALELDMSKL